MEFNANKELTIDQKMFLNETYKKILKIYLGLSEKSGICHIIIKLLSDRYLTKDGYDFIMAHFKSQKPSKTQHRDFYDNVNFTWGMTWWFHPMSDVTIDQRKKFLELLIELTAIPKDVLISHYKSMRII